MGFLHKLWDETLAGPTPDSGLGKLRKFNSFSAARSAGAPLFMVAPPHDDHHLIPITRSITMVRRDVHHNLTVSVDSPSSAPSTPSSPAASSGSSSPFSPSTPGGNFKKFTRRKLRSGALQNMESESKAGYDWNAMLNSMDR